MLNGGVAKIAPAAESLLMASPMDRVASSVLRTDPGIFRSRRGLIGAKYYINRFDGEKFTRDSLRLPTGVSTAGMEPTRWSRTA